MANEYTIGQSLRALAAANNLSLTEVDRIDSITPGTVVVEKALVPDSNGDIGTLGVVTAASFVGALTGDVTGNVDGNVSFPVVARTATADGTTTGTIAAAGLFQFVTVTASSADHIIILPAPTPGTIVLLAVGANGFELRSSAPATVAINGGAEANAESAIPANTLVFMVCTSATTWQGWDLTGTTFAAVEAAAAGA